MSSGNATEQAESAFSAARFEEASARYRQLAIHDPRNALAARRLGTLALFQNKLGDAERDLTRARSLAPASKDVAALLAETYTRQDAFATAAPLARAAGHEERALQLESFGSTPPFAVEGPDEAVVPFVTEDPLPVVEARGPDGSPLQLIIDTGAADLILDRRVAQRLGVPSFGDRNGIRAGGLQVPVGHGSLGAITLGGVTVRRLPVDLDATADLSELFGGRRIDGILGTVLLYHFRATLDYPGRRLVLRRRKARDPRCDGAVVPFLLAGSHAMIARGGLGPLRDMVWLIDTGLADGGFSAPESTLKAAGISVDRTRAEPGNPGTQDIPFVVPELSLGAVGARNVPGVFVEPETPFRKLIGFRVDGLVSHAFFKPYAVTFDFERMELCLQHG